MTDREKVITGLELCTNISPDGCLMLCPYKDEKDETYSGFCEQVLKRDALDLLKKQESTMVIESENMYTGLPITHCPTCGKSLDRYLYGRQHEGEINFCPYCGQALKWQE